MIPFSRISKIVIEGSEKGFDSSDIRGTCIMEHFNNRFLFYICKSTGGTFRIGLTYKGKS